MMEWISYWHSRAWCAIDGHQWMPNGSGDYVCIRSACRGVVCVGSDGLTSAERTEYAHRWREGAGRAPSSDEMREWARLSEGTLGDRHWTDDAH